MPALTEPIAGTMGQSGRKWIDEDFGELWPTEQKHGETLAHRSRDFAGRCGMLGLCTDITLASTV
jgi:hypothetical protein